MIPFPKMSMAQSVLNRIQNTLEESGPLGLGSKPAAPVELQAPPISPDPTKLGMELDTSLAQPPAPAAVPPGTESDAVTGMVTESALGGSPFGGLLTGSAGQV